MKSLHSKNARQVRKKQAIALIKCESSKSLLREPCSQTREKSRPDKITEMLSFYLSTLSLSHTFWFSVTFSTSVSPVVPLPLFTPSSLHSSYSSFSFLLLRPFLAVCYRGSFRTKRKHFDFQRDGRGQRELVDHADVDNRATGANLHIDIDQLFVRTAAVSASFPLAPPCSCIRTDLCRGRRRFSLGRLDYLGISLKYGMFVREKFAVRICADRAIASRGRLSSAQKIPTFHLFTRGVPQVIFFYDDIK